MTVNTSSPQDAMMAFGKKWWLLLILGVLSMVVGVMALNNPVSATATLVLLFGIWLLFSGIGTIVRALSDDTEGSGKVLMIISGSLSIILAVIFFNGGIVKDAQLAALFMGITFYLPRYGGTCCRLSIQGSTWPWLGNLHGHHYFDCWRYHHQ